MSRTLGVALVSIKQSILMSNTLPSTNQQSLPEVVLTKIFSGPVISTAELSASNSAPFSLGVTLVETDVLACDLKLIYFAEMET